MKLRNDLQDWCQMSTGDDKRSAASYHVVHACGAASNMGTVVNRAELRCSASYCS